MLGITFCESILTPSLTKAMRVAAPGASTTVSIGQTTIAPPWSCSSGGTSWRVCDNILFWNKLTLRRWREALDKKAWMEKKKGNIPKGAVLMAVAYFITSKTEIYIFRGVTCAGSAIFFSSWQESVIIQWMNSRSYPPPPIFQNSVSCVERRNETGKNTKSDELCDLSHTVSCDWPTDEEIAHKIRITGLVDQSQILFLFRRYFFVPIFFYMSHFLLIRHRLPTGCFSRIGVVFSEKLIRGAVLEVLQATSVTVLPVDSCVYPLHPA